MKPPFLILDSSEETPEGYMRYQLVGLGDLVAALLGRVGIHPWPGCGCAKRQKWLNQMKVAILV